jgi:hypothetical protein
LSEGKAGLHSFGLANDERTAHLVRRHECLCRYVPISAILGQRGGHEIANENGIKRG